MGWWNTRYKSRPASKNKAARVAWDELSAEAASMEPPRTIDFMWCATEMEAWVAQLNEIAAKDPHPYIEMDVLEVRDRLNNPHKYAAQDKADLGVAASQAPKGMA